MRIGRFTITRAGVAATVVVLLVAAACIRLGIWQLDRLEQRDRLNATVSQRMEAQPVLIERAPADTAGWAYRHVLLRGRCDPMRPIVLAGRSRHGMPGAHILCAFLPAGGGDAILLDRGWAPAPDARSVDPSLLPAPRFDQPLPVLLVPLPQASGEPLERDGTMDAGLTRDREGLTLEGEAEPEVLYRLNQRDATALLGYSISPLYAQLQSDSAATALPLTIEPPDLSRGPHLGYAIQWFSFAAIALIGWAALAWRRGEVRWSNGRSGTFHDPDV